MTGRSPPWPASRCAPTARESTATRGTAASTPSRSAAPPAGPRCACSIAMARPSPCDPLVGADRPAPVRRGAGDQGCGRLPPRRPRHLGARRGGAAGAQAPRGQALRPDGRRPGDRPPARRGRRRRGARPHLPAPSHRAPAPAGRRRGGPLGGSRQPLAGGDAPLQPAPPPDRARAHHPLRPDQRQRLRRAHRLPGRRGARPAERDRRRLPHPRPPHPHADRRLGDPRQRAGGRRRCDARAGSSPSR